MTMAIRAPSQPISRPPPATQSGWVAAFSQSVLCSAWMMPSTSVKATKEAAELSAVCSMMRSLTRPCALPSSMASSTTLGRRGHGHGRRRRRPARTHADQPEGKGEDQRKGQGDVAQGAAQQFRVAEQPAEIEPAADFHHQQAERGIGQRPCLGQRLEADPAEQGRAEQGAGQHVADHLRPAGAGVQPFAEQQADDQQQAEQGQRIELLGEGGQEEQALEQRFPRRPQGLKHFCPFSTVDRRPRLVRPLPTAAPGSVQEFVEDRRAVEQLLGCPAGGTPGAIAGRGRRACHRGEWPRSSRRRRCVPRPAGRGRGCGWPGGGWRRRRRRSAPHRAGLRPQVGIPFDGVYVCLS